MFIEEKKHVINKFTNFKLLDPYVDEWFVDLKGDLFTVDELNVGLNLFLKSQKIKNEALKGYLEIILFKKIYNIDIVTTSDYQSTDTDHLTQKCIVVN